MSQENKKLKAALELIEHEKRKAEESCASAINSTLSENNCDLKAFVMVGGVFYPIEQVLNLPFEFKVIKKK